MSGVEWDFRKSMERGRELGVCTEAGLQGGLYGVRQSFCLQNLALFKTILKDCFLGLPDPPSNIMSAKSRSFDIEAAIESKAQDLGLIAHKPWVARCLQLYNLAQVHHGTSGLSSVQFIQQT